MSSKFPIQIKQCPHCGGQETVAFLAAQEEIEKGRLQEGQLTSLWRQRIPIVRPETHQGLTLPILVVHHDICSNPDCGHEYVTLIEKLDIPITAEMRTLGQNPGGPQLTAR